MHTTQAHMITVHKCLSQQKEHVNICKIYSQWCHVSENITHPGL